MAEFKLNIGDPKTGKTHKKDVVSDDAKIFLQKKIGDKIKGDSFDLSGYEFEITGGSDFCGFPMRKDVRGARRKRILITSGVGTRHNRKGIRLRRTVAGNTIYAKTAQINLKVLKYGKKPLVSVSAESPKEEVKEEKKEVAPKEEAKPEEKEEETKEEEKGKEKEEKKEDAPKEEAPKAEEKEKKKEEKAKEEKEEVKEEKAPKEEAKPEKKREKTK